MKKTTLSLLFSCLILTAIAQNDSASESFLRKKFYPEYITLSDKQPAQDSLAWFSQISVIDLRRDTSRIGLSGTRYTRRQMFFHTNASNTIQTWLRSNYIHGADKGSLLVVIKDLWLFDSEEELTEGQRELPNNSSTLRIGNLEFRCEAYLAVDNKYIPVTYLDTAITSTFHTASLLATYQIPEALEAFMEKVASRDLNALIANGRRISYTQIDSFSHTRYSYPMDTAVILREGVYASIEDFKNNQPSLSGYQVTKDRHSNIQLRLTDTTDKSHPKSSVWGFCDGAQSYIRINDQFYPIMPVQHQFYVFAPQEYTRIRKDSKATGAFFSTGVGLIPLTFNIPGSIRTSTRLTLFRLNIRSGEIEL
ncbi:MAG TPA: hypothetical protein VIM64_19105 [Puia sp.]